MKVEYKIKDDFTAKIQDKFDYTYTAFLGHNLKYLHQLVCFYSGRHVRIVTVSKGNLHTMSYFRI